MINEFKIEAIVEKQIELKKSAKGNYWCEVKVKQDKNKFTLKAFGNTAETLSKTPHLEQTIIFIGKISSNLWKDNTGAFKRDIQMVIDNYELVSDNESKEEDINW